MPYQPIIGLEIHIKPKTQSKMFCGCVNASDELAPNTAVCPICTGHPGVLPVINRQVVEWGAMMAMALNCKIPAMSKFDRKSYFYPDLPKGFQISMFDMPIGTGGWLEVEVDDRTKKIHIQRLHLEEDAAKLVHVADGSLVDFNRAGTPLFEIVTHPDLRNPQEAKAFLHELRLLARYLGVSEADMEKGQLRCDANISLTPSEEEQTAGVKLYPKTEIKNLNSFRAVERALEYEIIRQTKLWEKGTPPQHQSTRGWDEGKQETFEQRVKEEAHDYRYFPEPDLPPLKFGEDVPKDSDLFDTRTLFAAIPETPGARRKRFVEQYAFSKYDTRLLIEDRDISDFTEQVVTELQNWLHDLEGAKKIERNSWEKNKSEWARLVGGWIHSKLFKLLNEQKITIKQAKVTPENFAELMTFIYRKIINSTAAQQVLEDMVKRGSDPSHVIEELGLAQESDEGKLYQVIEKIIKANPKPVEDYRHGKENAVQFLAGQVMKETRGKSNPEVVIKLLKEKL